MIGRLLIAVTLVGVSLSILDAGTPASGALRLDTRAVIQADAETVDHIVEVLNRAEEAIVTKDLDALMTVYSERYRYQTLADCSGRPDTRRQWPGQLR